MPLSRVSSFRAGKLSVRIAHRHLVFTIPKRLRPHFKFNRDLLRQMSGWAYGLIRALLASQVPLRRGEAPGSARPGWVAVLSLAGRLRPQPSGNARMRPIGTGARFEEEQSRPFPGWCISLRSPKTSTGVQ